MRDLFGKTDRFSGYAWFFVLYLIGVILFGAWVRITGSGAGCGSHWPTCHGEIIPIAPTLKTKIEYTHRLTSGMCGIFGLVMVGWAWARNRAASGELRRVLLGSSVTLLFIIFEGAIGAGLVLKELVANDDSVARAIIIALHLVNTLALTGAASLTAWWAGGNPTPTWSRVRGPLRAALALGLLSIAMTSMSGAVTALGDTLFPVNPTVDGGLMARMREGMEPAHHFLIRLRALHPFVALMSAGLLMGLSWSVRNVVDEATATPGARKWASLLGASVVGQVLIGITNVTLAAPGWVQLVHLLAAQLLWICAVMMSASLLTSDALTAES